MKIEVLMAIRSKGKKDINAILSSINLDSDVRIAIYHYNGAKEERLSYNGHTVNVHYIADGKKMGAYNTLLGLTDAGVVLFADPTQKFITGYQQVIENAFEEKPKCDGILFGAGKEAKRVGSKEVFKHSFTGLCIKTSVLRERELTFIDIDDETFNEGVISVFRNDFVAWPSRCFGKADPIILNDEPIQLDEINRTFYDTHRIGIAWPFLSLGRYLKKDKKKRSFKDHLRDARAGHHAYLFRGYEEENKRIKENPLPFVIMVMSLLGLAIQLVLSLLIVFTEAQYIPIWVALVFVVLFAVIYAFAAPKVHNAKAILINGISIGAVSFAAALITYLAMKVSWAMAIYGAFICLVVVLGVIYCFAPPRAKKK